MPVSYPITFAKGFGALCHQRSQGDVPVCLVTDLENHFLFSNSPDTESGEPQLRWFVTSAKVSITRFFSASTAFINLSCKLENIHDWPQYLPRVALKEQGLVQGIFTNGRLVEPEDEIMIYMGYLPCLRPIRREDLEEDRLLRVMVCSIDTISVTGTQQGIIATIQCRDRIKYLMDTQVRLSTKEEFKSNFQPSKPLGEDNFFGTFINSITNSLLPEAPGEVADAINPFPYYQQQPETGGLCQTAALIQQLKAAGITTITDSDGKKLPLTIENVNKVYPKRSLQTTDGYKKALDTELQRSGKAPSRLLKSTSNSQEAIAQIKEALDRGEVVNLQSYMTDSGHFVTITGYNDHGFIVQDPYGKWNGSIRQPVADSYIYGNGQDQIYSFDRMGKVMVEGGPLTAVAAEAEDKLIKSNVVGYQRSAVRSSTTNFNGLGYNPTAANQYLKAVRNNMAPSGYCFQAVADIMMNGLGRDIFVDSGLPAAHAWQAATILERYPNNFAELKLPSTRSAINQVLSNLPPGAIVVWDSGMSASGHPSGHISITTRPGEEVSSSIMPQMLMSEQNDGKRPPRVFLPTNPITRDTRPTTSGSRLTLVDSKTVLSSDGRLVTAANSPWSSVNAERKSPKGPTTITSETPALAAFASYVGQLESGNNYGTANNGEAGGVVGHDFNKLTIREVMAKQDAGEIFAVGRYQIVPKTMKEALRATGIPLDATYGPEAQDRLFKYLITDKRPVLRDYLLGKHDDVNAAIDDLAYEFASIKKSNGVGAYDGDSAGNSASGEVETTRRLLKNLKAEVMRNPSILDYRLPGAIGNDPSFGTLNPAPGSSGLFTGPQGLHDIARSAFILSAARMGIGHVDTLDVSCQLGGILIQAPDPSKGELFDLQYGTSAEPDQFYQTFLYSTTSNRDLKVEYDPKFMMQVGRIGLLKGSDTQQLVARSLTLINQAPIDVIKFFATQEPYPTEVFMDNRTGNYFYAPRAVDMTALKLQDRRRFGRTYYFRNVPQDVDEVDVNQMLLSFKEEFTSLGTKTNFIVSKEDTSSANANVSGGMVALHAAMRPNFLIGKRIAAKVSYVVDNTIMNYGEAGAVALAMARITAKEGRVGMAVMLGDPSLIPGELVQIIGSPLYPKGLQPGVAAKERLEAVEYNDRFRKIYRGLLDLVLEGKGAPDPNINAFEKEVVYGATKAEDITREEQPEVIERFTIKPATAAHVDDNLKLMCAPHNPTGGENHGSMVSGVTDSRLSGFKDEPRTIFRVEGVIHEFNTTSRGYETHVALLSPF